MDIKHWCGSGHESIIIRDSHRFSVLKFPAAGLRTRRWRTLWRRIIREKKKLFDCSPPAHLPYDPQTYSQNFDDQGLTWADPDNASRSFSARFAVPSRIFEESWVMGFHGRYICILVVYYLIFAHGSWWSFWWLLAFFAWGFVLFSSSSCFSQP